MINDFIYTGNFNDPHDEFFVEKVSYQPKKDQKKSKGKK